MRHCPSYNNRHWLLENNIEMSNIDNPNSNNNYNDRIYNCAGNGCKNSPSHLLKLVLFKKFGYFCQSCTEYLKDNGLIDSVLDESIAETKRKKEE